MVRFLRYPRARDAFVHSRRHPAQSVIPTYALRRLSAFVTNATLALTEDDASSVVRPVSLPFRPRPHSFPFSPFHLLTGASQVSLTLTTVRSARG